MPKKKQKSSLNAAKGARGSHHCKGGGEGGLEAGRGGRKCGSVKHARRQAVLSVL